MNGPTGLLIERRQKYAQVIFFRLFSNPNLFRAAFFAVAAIVVAGLLCTAQARAAELDPHGLAVSTPEPALLNTVWLILLPMVALFGLRQKSKRPAESVPSAPANGIQPVDPQYRLLFDSNPMPLLVYDANTFAILAVNEATIREYGYSHQDFLSLSLQDIQLEAKSEDAPDHRGDYTSRTTGKHRKSDGSVIDVEMRSQSTTFDGRDATLIATSDISKRVRDLEKRNQERHLFLSLMDKLPGFIYAKDTDSRFVFANMTVAASKGEKRPENLIGKSDFDYYPTELASQYRATEQEIMTTGRGLVNFEVVDMDESGNKTWSLNTKVPWLDSEGGVIGILGMNYDITERKQAEDALKEAQALFNSLFNSLPQNIYCKDKDGRLSFGNKAFCETIGRSLDQIVGKTEADLFPAELARKHEPEDLRVVGGEVLDSIEIHKTPSGQKRHMQSVRTPRYDSKGEIAGLQAIFWDVTERVQSEEALHNSLAQLKTIVSAVSEGDLTKRAVEDETTLGQIAKSVNRMLDNFSKMILQVKELGLTVSSSATQILAASEQMAVGSQRQAEEITITSTAVEEMAASMNQVSKNAENTTDAAHRALDTAGRGDVAARDTFEAIEKIDSAVRMTAEKMHVLAQRTKEISEILVIIDGIASQTNLLSLNAAIQAAHAGDAGLGFSVVADEIRKLAERSGQLTKDINKIIKAIQRETEEALASMDQAMKEVTGGSEVAKIAGQSIQEISTVVTQSASLIEEISVAAEEQAKVSRSIASAMQTISSIAIQTSSGTHETSHIVSGLVRISEELSEAILKFKINAENVA